VDATGDLYVATGNGNSSTFDYGNAVIKLSPSLQTLGFFAPQDAGARNLPDLDLGSTGPVLLPHSRAFIVGKAGVGYLLDTSQLGGIGHPLSARLICAGAFGGVAYAHGVLYVPCIDGMVAVTVSGNTLSVDWRQSDATQSPIRRRRRGMGHRGRQSLPTRPPRRSGPLQRHDRTACALRIATAADNRVYVAAGDRRQASG
jgi:hypothetical protein